MFSFLADQQMCQPVQLLLIGAIPSHPNPVNELKLYLRQFTGDSHHTKLDLLMMCAYFKVA
jgi:hypothetical protein